MSGLRGIIYNSVYISEPRLRPLQIRNCCIRIISAVGPGSESALGFTGYRNYCGGDSTTQIQIIDPSHLLYSECRQRENRIDKTHLSHIISLFSENDIARRWIIDKTHSHYLTRRSILGSVYPIKYELERELLTEQKKRWFTLSWEFLLQKVILAAGFGG